MTASCHWFARRGLAAGRMGAEPEETLVFEDMIIAVNTARGAGYRVVGICDENSKKDWDRILAGSDFGVHSLAEWPGLEKIEDCMENKSLPGK